MDAPVFGVLVIIIIASLIVAAIVKLVTWIVSLVVGLWWVFLLVALIYFVGPYVMDYVAHKHDVWRLKRTYTSTRADLITDAERTREQMRRVARGEVSRGPLR